MHKLRGTGVALVTPFHPDGSLDLEGLERLVQHTEAADYRVVMGTTGESATLSKSEKKVVLETVTSAGGGRRPLVLGWGGNHTRALLDDIQSLNPEGVDALLSVSPYYNKPSQEGLYRHYSMLADAAPRPLILYNVPGRTGSNLSAATTLRLARHGNIAGIKEASGSVEQAMAIARGMPPGFLLISGDDLLTPALMAVGASGVISVLANAWPREFADMVRYCHDSDFESAAAFWKEWIDLNPLLYEEGNPAGIKAVLALLGICGPDVRLPLAPAGDDLRSRISAALPFGLNRL